MATRWASRSRFVPRSILSETRRFCSSKLASFVSETSIVAPSSSLRDCNSCNLSLVDLSSFSSRFIYGYKFEDKIYIRANLINFRVQTKNKPRKKFQRKVHHFLILCFVALQPPGQFLTLSLRLFTNFELILL